MTCVCNAAEESWYRLFGSTIAFLQPVAEQKKKSLRRDPSTTRTSSSSGGDGRGVEGGYSQFSGANPGRGDPRLGWWWWIFLILLKRIRRIHQILILRIGILRIRICEVWMTDYLPSPIKFVWSDADFDDTNQNSTLPQTAFVFNLCLWKLVVQTLLCKLCCASFRLILDSCWIR